MRASSFAPLTRIRSTALVLASAILSSTALVGCSNDSDTSPKLVTAFSGEGQNAAVGTAAPTPLTVRVIDGDSKPVAGAVVTFAATGGATLSTTTATTDANGLASASVTLGTRAGVDSVTAAVSGASIDPTIFMITADPGAPAAIVAESGGNVSAAGGSSVTLTAMVTDQYGNAVPNVIVDWTTSAGTLLPQALSDDSGTASDVIQLPGAPATVTVTAKVDGTTITTTFVDTAI